MATIIADDQLHCRWLNTLSMLENVGACKITESERYFRGHRIRAQARR